MLQLYFRLIGARIRSQMQYRASFMLELVAFALMTGVDFVVIALIFGRTAQIGGWTIAEAALLYGISNVSWSISEMWVRGFDAPFEKLIQQGGFDGIMLRPLGTFFQILASDFQLRRLGRTAQSLVVLIYAIASLNIQWSLDKVALLPIAILAGVFVYAGITVIGATICFWTIRTPEVINVLTVGGAQFSSYPLTIYNRPLQAIFLFVIPVAICNYPAALWILDRTDPFGIPASLAWVSPLVALIFFALAYGFWLIGVGKYQSTGS